jgi:gp32 DNA binding protein like
MVINVELMRRKLESSRTNGKSDKKESIFFKPIAGDQEVRFLPSEDGDPFKEYHFHYGLGEAFLCPKKNFNEKCSVCDYAWNLWREGGEENQKMAKGLFSRQRFFSNVVTRGQEALGPKPYGYGKETYEQLIEIVLDPDYGDITDVEAGRDFKLNYKLAEKKGAFPKTKLTVKPKSTPLSKTPKESKELLEKAKPIESFLTRKTPAEVKEILEKFLEDPYSGEELEKYGAKPEKTSSSSSEEPSSVDDAINELMS